MNRKKLILVTLLAVLSLFVSVVSACACSHHEPVKAEAETSCHGASNEPDKKPAQTENNSDRLDSDCGCLVRTQVPAIVFKTDDKRTTIEKDIPDGATGFSFEINVAVARIQVSGFSWLTPHLYKRDLLSSLPSRAPPRL